MKLDDFIKSIENEHIKLAVSLAFKTREETEQEYFDSCLEISELIIKLINFDVKKISQVMSVMPANYAKATLMLVNISNSEYSETIKRIEEELNKIYVEQFRKIVKNNPNDFVSYSDEKIKEYETLKRRVVDSIEIISIAKSLNVDINNCILGKYSGDDNNIKLLNKSRYKLRNGEIYKQSEKIISRLFHKIARKVKAELSALLKNDVKGL